MNGNRWHLDRRVSVGHIVTTLVVAVSAAIWMLRLESNVLLNEQAILSQAERIDWVERAVKEDQKDIKTTLRRIWDTLRRVEDKIACKADKP
jgi:predicted secreted protein